MPNPPLMLVHFLGFALSSGSLLILDLRFSTLLFGRRVRHFDIVLVHKIAPAVRLGLVLLWTSGLGLVFESAASDPHLLADPKLQAKVIIVAVLTINGILVEKLCLPALARSEGQVFFAPLTRIARFELIAIAAISAVSWCFAALLALSNKLHVDLVADATTILRYYGGTLAFAVALGTLIVRRIPRSAAASGLEFLRSPTTSGVKPRRAKKSPSYLRKRVRTAFIGVAASSLVINLLTLTTAIFMMQILNRVLSDRSRDTLLYLTVIAVMAVAILSVFDFMRRKMLIRLGCWLERSLSPTAYLKGLENARTDKFCFTEILRELGMLRALLCSTSMVAFFDMFWIPVHLVVIYAFSPLLGLISLCGALLLAFVSVGDRLTATISRDAQATSFTGLRAAEIAFRNTEVVYSMNMESALAKIWRVTSEQAVELTRQASNRSALIASVSKFLELAVQVLVIGAGAWLILNQQLSIGAMIVGAMIVVPALRPITQSIGTWERTMAARQAWRRVRPLLSQKLPDNQTLMLPRPLGHLTVESVTYAPADREEPVIRTVSMDARPGEVLAVTGPSGAGKSTLARLMLGLARAQAGAVFIDGCDISLIDRRQFGQHIGYMPQEVELFPGTVFRNIARMNEGTADDAIEAADLAGAHEMILRLPLGYNTIVGHEGCGLSSGEQRLIALARAFYRRPAVLVLDEPSTSLDVNGENALGEALAAFRDIGTTIVILAKQPGLLAHADRIAVLNGGRLSMLGSRDQVLSYLARPPAGRRGPSYMRIIQ